MLINLTYKGNPKDEIMHCMIGKGIIFDTGGYHLKPYGNGGVKSKVACFFFLCDLRPFPQPPGYS